MSSGDRLPTARRRFRSPAAFVAPVLLFLLVAAAAFAAASFAAEDASKALKKASLTLHWYPQTQFAGYYMAREKGFFAQRGIDMEIRRGGADVDVVEELRSGRTLFSTMFLTGALRFRTEAIRLVNVGQIVNRSNLLIVAKKKSGIRTVKDLNGRKMSLWGDHFAGAYKKLFAAKGIWPVIRPQFFSVDLFLRGAVDACNAMTYNEYVRILQAGHRPDDLTVISLREEGYDFPEDGIYCLEATWTGDPQLCRDVRDASLEGWRYAAAHPDEAVDLILKLADEVGYTVNRLLLRSMLLSILPSIFPESSESGVLPWVPGALSRKSYENTVAMMNEVFVGDQWNVSYDIFHPVGVEAAEVSPDAR